MTHNEDAKGEKKTTTTAPMKTRQRRVNAASKAEVSRLEDRPRPSASRTCISAAKALTGAKTQRRRWKSGEEIFKAAAEL